MKKIAMVFFLVCSVVFARAAYDIENLNIVANIQSDGSINIQERILYDIDDINGIFYNIDALGYGHLKNLEIYYEDKVDDNFQKAIPSTYLERGNYTVAEKDGLYKIKLYAPARNEQKEFIFKYTLTDGINVYKDIAQLNRKMVGKAWDEPIKHIKITINLPKAVPKNEIYAFGHGPLHGNIDIVSGKQIVYTIDNYYPGKFLETNLLFPTSVVDKISPSKIIDKNALPQILQMEKKLAEKANLTRKKAIVQMRMGKIVFALGVIWWLGVVIYVYIKNSKKYKVKNEYGEYFRELPDDYSPAIAGTLVARKNYPGSRELFASILDLIRKKQLKLVEENGKTILEATGENIDTLKDYEKFLFKWYVNGLGDGKKVVLEDINSYIANKSSAQIYNSNYERWQTMIYTDMLSKNLKNDKRDTFSSAVGILTGIGFFMGGMPLMDYFHSGIFLGWVIMGFVLFPYTLSRRRYSLEKEEACSRWEAFKKFLVDYSNLEEAKLASIKLWEHYFVYAVALGVAQKVAKGYEKIMAEKGENSNIIRMSDTSLMGLYLYSGIFERININTEKAVSTSLESIAKSNMSSSIGSGGGFSGGSSGGGGDRGGGGAF